jgi:Skp family chaperone for outer membrane proteins
MDMKNICKPSIVALLALAAVSSLVMLGKTIAQPLGVPAGTPTRVAVCNIVEVFQKYQRAQDLTVKLNERKGTIEAENERRVKELQAKQLELEGLKPGMPEHDKLLEQIRRMQLERQLWLKMEEESILRDHLRLTEEMFKEIREAVGSLAKEQGFELVLQLEPGDIEARNAQELIAQIDRQKILYYADGMDITAAVLQRLDEAYRVRSK